ncbi:alpha/beta fold hydrolase [bacterium]|nr:alpha/beta fold hydrolase [bacterium]
MKIFLIHGWGQSKEVWNKIKSMLEPEYQVVAIDLPGFGTEPLISEDWKIPDYAEWLYNEIDTNNSVLLGHSFGGRVAAYLVSTYSTNLKGLILSGTPGLYRSNLIIKLKVLRYKFLRLILPETILQKFRTEEDNHSRANGLRKIRNHAIGFDQTKTLSKIRIPTCIIVGGKDPDVSLSISREMKKLIPNSIIEILPKLGHNTFLENPNIYYGKIKNFIKGI